MDLIKIQALGYLIDINYAYANGEEKKIPKRKSIVNIDGFFYKADFLNMC